MQDVGPNPLCHWCGERGHKQAECSRHRASSEGERSRSVAPSAAKTGSAALTSEIPGRESARTANSSGGGGAGSSANS